MQSIHVAILKDNYSDDYRYWIKAIHDTECDITYDVVDIIKSDWLEKIQDGCYSLVLSRPPGSSLTLKKLYDERLYVIERILNIPIFPVYTSALVYENKNALHYVLSAHSVPMPLTKVFYAQAEAMDYIKSCDYPFIAKKIIGAAGLGVVKIKNYQQAALYVKRAFSTGIGSKTGPDLRKPNLLTRIVIGIFKKGYLKQKLLSYKSALTEKQKGFVFFQEYIPHAYEWRVVRIGCSYFAHKKLANDGMTSGFLLKEYGEPPLPLLNFVKEVSERIGIDSAAYDLFETSDGSYLVNEVQAIFGQSDPYQMLVDGEPGRYVFDGSNWIFEKGDFNSNKSYSLRLENELRKIGL